MKKSKIFFSVFLCFCFCLAFFIFPLSTSTKSYAEGETTTTEKITIQNCETKFNMDTTLFRVLNKLAEQITNKGKTLSGFEQDVFNVSSHPDPDSYYQIFVPTPPAEGEEANPNVESAEVILNDIKNGVLNLSTGKNAKYKCLKSIYNITDITGLNSLNLDNIHTLILDGNSLTNIDSNDFTSMFSLTNLSVSSNKLKTVTLNDRLNNLNSVDFSNNQIKKINLSLLVSTTGENAKNPSVNLSCNEISKLSDITLPTQTKLSKLNISFNNLSNITAEEISQINNFLVDGNTANILLQGTTDFSKLFAGDEIRVYQGGDIENFNIKIFYAENSEFYTENSNPICATSGEEQIETLKIPAGKIKVEFYSGETLISEENFQALDKTILNKLSGENIYSVPIKSLSYKAYSNNKEIKSLSSDSDIKVNLLIANIENIPNKNDILAENGVKFYFYRGAQKPTNSATIEITENGSYTYYAYATFDGIETGKIRLPISRKDLTGITWGIVIIVIVFVICAAIYFIIKWFREGAQVAPLSDKEIYRMNKRKGTLTDINNDDYIASLDAPRHDTRVSDQGYSDNTLEENLNETSNYYDKTDYKNTDASIGDLPEDIDK